jgi:hypothetical protein
MNKPGKIGTQAETDSVRFLVANGFPKADRRSRKGRYDQGDILLCDGVIAEVKVRADGIISRELTAAFMLETAHEVVNARAIYGFLIVKRKFQNVRLWPTYWFARDVVRLHIDNDPPDAGCEHWTEPLQAIVSMTFQDSMMMLRHCGFGDPI